MTAVISCVSFLAVVLVIGCSLYRHGRLPSSVSAMAYAMPGRRRLLWTLWMWTAVFTLTPGLFEAMPDGLDGLSHAFATNMLLITLMPLIKRDMSNGHRALIVSAGLLSQACTAVLCPWLLLAWPAAVVLLLANGLFSDDIPRILWGKGVLLLELLCYLTLFSGIFIKLL